MDDHVRQEGPPPRCRHRRVRQRRRSEQYNNNHRQARPLVGRFYRRAGASGGHEQRLSDERRRSRRSEKASTQREHHYGQGLENKAWIGSRSSRSSCSTAATLIPATTAQGGGKYGNLTTRWWQWVLAQPAVDVGGTNTNPLLDTTGDFAAVGQENGIGPGNKYFFLTGNFGGVTRTVRTVTVPEGKALFFPIFNIEVDNAVEPPTNHSVPALTALAKAAIDGATTVEAQLDGEDIEIFRTTSPTFSYTVPEENSIYEYFGLVGPQFEGRIEPVVADGYWAYIPPPSPGEHILEFDSAAASTGFELHVTYLLTIQ